ncbi:MAG: DNA-protecting protein DprA [Ignavibacteriae bacterium]|nr:DNA-protecting protein DprA [Ignavibacteriota bacterium]
MTEPGNWNLEDILTFSYTKGVNSSLLRKAVEGHESLAELLESGDGLFADKINQHELFNDIKSSVWGSAREEAKRQIEYADDNNCKIVTIWDDNYPELLKDIVLPPIVIYVKGKLQSQGSVSISMVGTRKCSQYGKLTAENFAEYFANQGIIVTSGLAYGIDTIAHLSAVKSEGISYAIVAAGIDMINPEESVRNSNKIVDSGGAIISEYKFGTSTQIGYFPQRNRIISGISLATVIVECGYKSGALITAKFALDQQREVFAVPGRIDSEKSKGTNLLIKNNQASPALSPEQILIDLGLSSQETFPVGSKKPLLKMNKIEQNIYDLLSNEPVHIDEIASGTNYEINEILVAMLEMEFKDIIRQLPGKYYIRRN